MHYLKIISCLLVFALISSASQLQAQKREKRGTSGWVIDPVSGTTWGDLEYKLTREEKNTLIRCPLHNKAMKLNEEYEEHPELEMEKDHDFSLAKAYHYRRHCARCDYMLKHNKVEKKEPIIRRKPTIKRMYK